MARLFIRHKPVECDVTVGISWTDDNDWNMRKEFMLDAKHIHMLDLCYVCFVHDGHCWAARSKRYFSRGLRTAIVCVPFNDDPSGQQMILTDMILN